MGFITALLAKIIRPIIKDELRELKEWAFDQSLRLESYKEIDKESDDLIIAASNATTTEEVRAHLRRLADTRARIRK